MRHNPRSALIAVIAALLVAGPPHTLGSEAGQIAGHGQKQSAGSTARQSAPLRSFLANDATYSVSLPVGWRQVGQATLDYGLFFGTQSESFATGMEQVFPNAAMLRANVAAYNTILPRTQLALKNRMLAPPLSPLQIVTTLFPQVAGGPRGAIQNLRVQYSIPANLGYGYQGMLIGYQYIFMPQRDPAFASQAHPALRAQGQVPMQGAAFVITFPYTPGQATWTFGYRILSAPQSVFQSKKNQATYVAIFDSFQLIPQGLALKVKSNEEAAKLAESMNKTTHDVAHDWWVQLGGLAEPAGGDYNASTRPALPDRPVCGPGETSFFCRQPNEHWTRCLKYPPVAGSQDGWDCTGGARQPGTPR